MKDTPSAKWLHNKFLKWQLESGRKKTVIEFAQYLGIPRGTLNQWMNGERTPTGLYVHKIVERLGPELYDVLGLARPEPVDPTFQDLANIWGDIPNAIQDELLRLARRAIDHQREASMVAPPVAKPIRKRAG